MRAKADKTTSRNGGDIQDLNNSQKKSEPDIL